MKYRAGRLVTVVCLTGIFLSSSHAQTVGPMIMPSIQIRDTTPQPQYANPWYRYSMSVDIHKTGRAWIQIGNVTAVVGGQTIPMVGDGVGSDGMGRWTAELVDPNIRCNGGFDVDFKAYYSVFWTGRPSPPTTTGAVVGARVQSRSLGTHVTVESVQEIDILRRPGSFYDSYGFLDPPNTTAEVWVTIQNWWHTPVSVLGYDVYCPDPATPEHWRVCDTADSWEMPASTPTFPAPLNCGDIVQVRVVCKAVYTPGLTIIRSNRGAIAANVICFPDPGA